MYRLLFPLWFVVTRLISFGAKNDAEIARLSFVFGIDLQMFLALCKVVLGLDVVIVDGVRSAAEQAALHKANPKNPLLGGDHQTGNAVDLNFWKNGKAVLLKANSAAHWQPVYELAAMCKISNGSTFRGYADNNHFYKKRS